MSDIDTDRDEFYAAVREQSWDDGVECPTCHGEGKVRPGRRLVHCVGSVFGADWDEQTVLDTIASARSVEWLEQGPLGYSDHQLVVVDSEGKRWRFQVRPSKEEL